MLAVDRINATRLLTLDRPKKRNALHPDLIAALVAALDDAEASSEIRAVVITGAGPGFSAGLDLDHLTTLEPEAAVAYMGRAFQLFQRVYTLRQPVIAAVNGPAMAGGFDLAAFCDIRLCSTEARFAQTEILLGLTQIIYPVYEIIGLGRAKELALTGRPISAEEAYRIGLVSGVHDPSELLTHAVALADELAARPAEALFETKRLSRELVEPEADRAMTRMLDVISSRLRSTEHRDALESRVEALRHRRSRRGD